MTEQRKRKYDSTVARIAGNVAGSRMASSGTWGAAGEIDRIAVVAVKVARAIVAEVERTEPTSDPAESH